MFYTTNVHIFFLKDYFGIWHNSLLKNFVFLSQFYHIALSYVFG